MKKSILITVIIILLSRCDTLYIPTTHNVPMLKEKGESKINANIGLGDPYIAFDIKAANAITNKFALMASYMYAKDLGKESLINNYEYNHKFNYSNLELGFGYFKPNSNKVIELFGGIGYNTVVNKYFNSNDNSIFTDNSSVKSLQFFVQPSYGIINKHFEIIFTYKPSLVYINHVSYFFNSPNDSIFHPNLDYISNNKFHFVHEPSITMRAGYENLKFQFQVMGSTGLSLLDDSYTSYLIPYFKFRFGFGITYNFKYKDSNE